MATTPSFFLRFGMLIVPIKQYVAARNKTVLFTTLHDKCGSQAKTARVCSVCRVPAVVDPKTGEELAPSRPLEVADGATVKGYEVGKGSYVQISQAELDAVDVDSSKEMNVQAFVPWASVDPVFLEKSHYIGPADEAACEAFALFRAALQARKVAAVVQYIGSSREKVGVLRVADGGALFLHEAFYPEEVRSFEQENRVKLRPVEIKKPVLDLACQLIKSAEKPFDRFEGLYDKRQKAINDLIGAKVAGTAPPTVAAPATPAAPSTDLMAALQASLKVLQGGKKAGQPKAAAKKKAAPVSLQGTPPVAA